LILERIPVQAEAPSAPIGNTRSFRSWVGPALLIVICLLPILLYLPTLGAPLERDEGAYATVAAGMLHEKVPYRDLFDNKPPLVYGWYALSFLTLGQDDAAPRLFAAALLSLTVLSVFAYTRMILPRPAAYIAAGLFGASTGLPFISLHANTEAFLLLPLVTSLLAFTMGMRKDRLIWFFVAGLLSGLAVVTKQVAFWNLAALAAAAVWCQWSAGRRGWRIWTPSVYVVSGGVAVVGAVGLIFATLGAWDDFVYANISYNYRYVAFVASDEKVFVLRRSLLSLLFIFVLTAPLAVGALLGLSTVLRRRGLSWQGPLALWTLASALGVATGGRFYPHYFLGLMPALAVLTAIVVYRYRATRHGRRIGFPFAAIAGGLAAVSLTTCGLLYFAPGATTRFFSAQAYDEKRWAQQTPALAAEIAQRTAPGDTIFNYGREGQIYFYADRLPAAPFFYDWAYRYHETTLRQTIDDLRRAPPTYIVDTVQPPLFKESHRTPEFDSFLRERYELVSHEYFADIYELRDRPSSGRAGGAESDGLQGAVSGVPFN
jgi:4-amino-4-deoxy-L-arabinose transferase-like glycosyltransferase